MTTMDMLSQSGVVAVFGMSVVFGFLCIMVIAITLMGKVIHTLGTDKDAAQPAAGAAIESSAVTAAISAAITEYKKTNEGEKYA